MTFSRAELLEVANVAYRNIVEIGIGPALAAANFTEERRLADIQQAAALQFKREEQQAARGQRQLITQQVTEALEVCRKDLVAFKQAVRTADRLTGGGLYTRLGLKGQIPRSYSGFVAYARTIYNVVQTDSDAMLTLEGLGYSQVRFNELLQSLVDLEMLNCDQEKAKGDYQRLTDEVLALEKAVYDELMTLKSIVRTVFPGEAADSVLESLRLS